jgi:hypothetical protein
MGESTKPALKVRFDRRVRLEFRGATITSDAGLLAARELDEDLGLMEMSPSHVEEGRTGGNVQHQLVPLLRQSVYSRLAGYKEGKYALNWTRLSCHRFVANQVRLCLFILAYDLGNFLRRLALLKGIKDWALRSVQVKVIKIGGRLVRHARRLVFQLAEVAVPRAVFQTVPERIGRLCPAPG